MIVPARNRTGNQSPLSGSFSIMSLVQLDIRIRALEASLAQRSIASNLVAVEEMFNTYGLKRFLGDSYVHTGAATLYLVQGEDHNWQAFEFDGTTAMTTGPMTGAKPLTLAGVMALSYAETYTPE